MNFFKTILTLLYKEGALELNTGQLIGSMFLFALLAGVIFSMTLGVGGEITTYFPGVFWFSQIFAVLLILNRSIAREKENNCLEIIILSGSSREAVMSARIIANFFLFVLLSIVITPVFFVLFDMTLSWHILQLLLIVLTFQVGMAITGSIMSFLVNLTRMGELLLPVLLLPLLLPLILGATEATELAIQQIWNETFNFWLLLMLIYDLVYFTAAIWLSPYLLEV